MYLRHVPCMKIVSFFVSSFLMILGFPDSSVGKKKKKSPAMQETPVRFLGWEYPLEKGPATYSSILA